MLAVWFAPLEECAMQRRLRMTLAAVAAAGVAVLGAGTAEAQGVFKSDNDCPRFDKDKVAKEADFPNDHYSGNENAIRKDARDAHGDVYYTHQAYCDPGKPWRGRDWHDDSYNTFHFKREPGGNTPSSNRDENTYNDFDGYNKSFRKDPHKYTKLEPDHIGASKHPKYLSE